jgi:hypothetical protein
MHGKTGMTALNSDTHPKMEALQTELIFTIYEKDLVLNEVFLDILNARTRSR